MNDISKICKCLTLLLVNGIGVIACNSNDANQTLFNIDLPKRQVTALNENTIRVDIRVNNGVLQQFFIVPNQTQISAGLTGVRLNQNNSLQLTWLELLNGFDVELAQQNHSFVADGNTVVDSPFISNQYDYDGDGLSNLQERRGNTCVWSAIEACVQAGINDTPPSSANTTQTNQTQPEPPATNTNAQGNDVLLTGAFTQSGTNITPNSFGSFTELLTSDNFNDSNAIDIWFHSAAQGDVIVDRDSGAFCIQYAAGSDRSQELLTYKNVALPVELATYVVQFDLKVDRLAPVSVGVFDQTAQGPVLDHYVQGTTDWATHAIRFSSSSNSSVTDLGFQTLRSTQPTKYCIDNVIYGKL